MKIAILSLAMSALALPAAAQTETSKPAEPAPTAAQTDPAQSPAPGPGAARTQAAKPQDPASAGASSSFTAEQLEQIVAPIALHPDSLLAQILMASTYPLEIVEAYRWQQKNSSLKEKALEEALKKQDWDPAVKSICGLPSVLKQMNDSLDWTQDLGDAFLGQKEDLMKTVQKMRKKALEAGTLESGDQQKVTQEGDIVVIESTQTDVVYVPTYYPTAVYGAWSYPYYYYPPMYPPYPAGGLMFGFTVGVIWGGCWGGCNWGGNDVDIDINNFNNFNNNTNINAGESNLRNDKGGKGSFNHNPEHRKGANYKNPQTAQKYGGTAGSNRVSKDQARGHDRSGSKGGPGAGGQKPGAGNAPRPSTGNAPRPSTGNAGVGAGAKPTPRSSGGGSSAMSGSRSPGADRSASSRGSASRSGGGGGRSGGGGRGGGGGRR